MASNSNNLFIINTSSASSAVSTSSGPKGFLSRLIIDGLSIAVAYFFTFVACDLTYNDFSIVQSIKSSYWFVLGPMLYMYDNIIPLLEKIIQKETKIILEDVKEALTKLYDQWKANHPGLEPITSHPGAIGIFWGILSHITHAFVINEQVRQNMIENTQYLKKINKI